MSNNCDHVFRMNDRFKDECEKCGVSRGIVLAELLKVKHKKFPHLHVFNRENKCIVAIDKNTDCNTKLV
jgi:hypothetical protein